MFGKMRKADRQTGEAEAMEMLKKGIYGVMSTVGENGYAYGIPLSYILFNGSVYFHCSMEGSKLDNLKLNNKVSFCVVTKSDTVEESFSVRYESVIAFGKAYEVLGDEKRQAFVALVDKYSHAFLEKGKELIEKAFDKTMVIKIEIEHVTGKAVK